MDVMNKVIGVSVGLLVAALLLPMALNEIGNTTTTTWEPAVGTIFTVLLPILAVIGVAIYFIRN